MSTLGVVGLVPVDASPDELPELLLELELELEDAPIPEEDEVLVPLVDPVSGSDEEQFHARTATKETA